ncbi:MAG: nicotinamide riboside transporter PnuC [Bacteroidetes bacterium HGW-Bacteroidetes-5]|jgi:nicotinamide mononucleotide transporter|nr:MAG: nicotinamide riboside transporter PnuC [Bacteroidetes bacterium HGW-Bacteroidetes-5]
MLNFKHINTLKPFDWLLIGGIIFVNFLYAILEQELDAIGSLAAVSGVVCVVLVARGNIFNYLFGIINVSLYAWISFKAGLYGDAALNALYYFPMQFIGWYSWIGRRREEESVTIVARRLRVKERASLALFSIVITVLVAVALHYFKDPQPLKDSATTVLSIIAMFLMVRRFMEQWVLWVIVNLISVTMWIIALSNGESHAALMILMWIFYLANSLNGWVTWLKLSQNTQKENLQL